MRSNAKSAISKYDYDYVVIRYWQERSFSPENLRDAVEMLSYAPVTRYTGLSAVATIKTLDIRVGADPIIPYHEIWKKTPKEVWAMLDERIDRAIAEHRYGKKQ